MWKSQHWNVPESNTSIQTSVSNMSVSGRIQSVLPFSQFLEAAGHPCGGTTEVFLFEDPTQSGPSQSLSRSAGAVRAYGMALAASLTHRNSANVTLHIGSEGEGKTEVMIFAIWLRGRWMNYGWTHGGSQSRSRWWSTAGYPVRDACLPWSVAPSCYCHALAPQNDMSHPCGRCAPSRTVGRMHIP